MLLFFGAVVFWLTVFISFLFFSPSKDRVNLLFLGEAGSNHDGASLTDTIIFSSIAADGSVLISIPRDIWLDSGKSKINSLYSTGGFPKIESAMEDILGQKIDGSILIDFSLFERIIDQVGGVRVNVEAAFDDYYYPLPGKENDPCSGDPTLACRFEHLHFEAGWQTMDGQTALKFARSRHAEGDEGTDYARSRRQQMIIAALKNQVFSWKFLAQPVRVLELARMIKNDLKNDLSKETLLSVVKIMLWPKARAFSTYVLDGWEKAEGYLYHPAKHSSGLWVLLPQGNNWLGVHQFVESIL